MQIGLSSHHLIAQFFRFGLVGIVNTAITVAIIFVLMALSVSPTAANAIGFLAGLCSSFLLNRRFTFQKADIRLAEIRFLLAFLFCYGLNLIALQFLLHFSALGPHLSQLAAMAVYTLCFFVLSKWFVFSDAGFAYLRDFIATHNRMELFGIAAAAGMAGLGILYLFYKCFFTPGDPFDYNFIWLAGKVWNEGLNPYGDEYLLRSHEIFGLHQGPHHWVYAPHTWIIASFLGLLDYDRSVDLWNLFNITALVTGAGIVIAALRNTPLQPSILRALIFLIYLCLSFSTASALALGQASVLLFLAFALFIYGYVRDESWPMAIGLVMMLIKPNVGFAFICFLLADPKYFKTLVKGGILTILLTIPSFVIAGIGGTIGGFWERISNYGGFRFNEASASTGLRNLFYHLTDIDVSSTIFVLISGVAAIALSRLIIFCQHRGLPRSELAGPVCAILFAQTFLILSLHHYDFFVLGVIILLVGSFSMRWQLACFLPLLLLFRTSNLTAINGVDPETEIIGIALLVSIGAILLATVLWVYFARQYVWPLWRMPSKSAAVLQSN